MDIFLKYVKATFGKNTKALTDALVEVKKEKKTLLYIIVFAPSLLQKTAYMLPSFPLCPHNYPVR